jgi:hypothetical protein
MPVHLHVLSPELQYRFRLKLVFGIYVRGYSANDFYLYRPGFLSHTKEVYLQHSIKILLRSEILFKYLMQ